MEKIETHENYPALFVLLANLLTFSIYILGALILAGFGLIYVILYLIYCLWIELRLMSSSCIDCYYYGKTCFLGRGKIASIFLKKGNSQRFICRKINFKDLFPDLLISIVPLLAGIALLIMSFNWPLLGLVVALVILGFPVTGYLRGNLACKYCKQKEIGCPAQEMFNKT